MQENDHQDTITNEDNMNEEFANNSKERKKRRSKNDLDGRTYKCKHCEKTYLSEIALNNHVKNKHAHLVEIVSRGRGRPRKSAAPENLNNAPTNDHKFKTFFESAIRDKNKDQTDFDLVHAAKENFDNIYTKYKEKLFKEISSPEDFPLIEAKESTSVDFAFWKYIEYCKEKTNREYFDFLFKFVVLFRECININKGGKFTQTESPENVPDMCNDFVSEFMERQDYFGLDISELIEVIQHCCHWLWENHYTSSRLTLVSGQ